MTNQDKINIILNVVQAIFQSKLTSTDITKVALTTNTGKFTGRWFAKGLLRGFDFTINNNGIIVPLRILEQNPNKTDLFGNLKENAILARQGHQIAWVIRRDTNNFLGKVMDGKWIKNKPQATTQMQFNAAVPGAGKIIKTKAEDQYHTDYTQYDGDWQRDLPEIDPNEVTLYISGA